MWVRSLGWEDTLEKGMATHSSILAWRIPWTEEPGRLQSMGSQSVGHAEHTHKVSKSKWVDARLHTSREIIGGMTAPRNFAVRSS